MAKEIASGFMNRMKSDDDLRYKLAKANGVKISSIDRWMRDNDVRLTTVDNLDIIAKHYDVLEISELIQEKVA
jgi:hypothetical protein